MQQHCNKAENTVTRVGNKEIITSQVQAMGAAKQCDHTKPASQSHYEAKWRTKILLHVFGKRGNRGVLDLSQNASQNFRFVSEDLEIKSNTPQVSQIQKKNIHNNSTERCSSRKKQWSRSKHINFVIQDVYPCVCHEGCEGTVYGLEGKTWLMWQLSEQVSFICHTAVTS